VCIVHNLNPNLVEQNETLREVCVKLPLTNQKQPTEKSAGCLFIELRHDDDGVGGGVFSGGVEGGNDDFPLTGRDGFFVAGLGDAKERVFEPRALRTRRALRKWEETR